MIAFTLGSVFATKWSYQDQIQAVCFDLFNTLVDVGRVPLSVGRFTADILGLDRAQWRQACFGSDYNIREPTDSYETLLKLARSLKPDISIDLVKQAVTERQSRFDHALINVDKEILQSLKSIRNRKFRIGLISNASSSEVMAWPQSPLAELFDVVTFSCDCGYVKPEVSIYQKTLAQLEVQAKNSLFVGDGGSDEHLGASLSGMKPIMITHYQHEESKSKLLEKYRDVLVGVVKDLDELEVGLKINRKGA